MGKVLTELYRIQFEEQSKTILELRQTIDNLNKTIDGLNQTIKELTEKLNKNSRNSSKPPSSDGLNKPSPKSLRKPSGKKAGGQPNHPGNNLVTMAEPDEIIQYMPSACSTCYHRETCKDLLKIGETRKVIDAIIEVKVTEHQALVLECPRYGMQQKGEFPSDIKAVVQYGENLQALAVALNTIGAVSVNRTHEILSGVFGIPLSTGTISNMVNHCAHTLNEIDENIRMKLTEADVLNCDETGTRVDGNTVWVHNASNSHYTSLTIHDKRGQEGMDNGKVLPEFNGIVVHDCWAPYWKYSHFLHALCNAHLLRELTAVEENYPEQRWPTEFIHLLLEMKRQKEHAVDKGKIQLTKELYHEFNERYNEIIAHAYAENPYVETKDKKRGRKKKGKTLALIERLSLHKKSICMFIHKFVVPFDNNQAERDIRMIKVKTKVSGCFRSNEGASNYLKIMSYVGTAKKHGYSAFKAIQQAISGNPSFIFFFFF
jgi:transposase